MAKFTSETAKQAGAKSKPGIHKKTLQWQVLADKFTGHFADKVVKHLNTLADDDMDKFMEHYKDLLNYFKPKMQSSQVKTEGSIKINIVNADGIENDF
jgi:translation initiation factor 2 alpha subunit (eIF-2alpha)